MEEKRRHRRKEKPFWFSITHTKSMTKEEYIKLIRRVIRFIVLIFVVSLAVFIGVAVFGGIGHVFGIILGSNLTLYSLAFVSVFCGYMISFGKWRYYMKLVGLHVPWKKNLAVYLSLYSMELTPARIGRVMAAYTLNRITSIRFINIIPMVTIDIFTDFLGMAFIALASAIYFDKFIILVVIADFVLLLPFLFILSDWFFHLVKRLIKSPTFYRIFTTYGREYFSSQSKLQKPEVYLVSMAFTIPSALLYTLSLYFSLLAVGAVTHASTSVFIFSFSQIIGMLTAIPGNVGVTDASLVTLLSTSTGLSAALASAVTIMARIATLWFGVALGAAALFYTLRYWYTPPQREESPQLSPEGRG